MSPTQTPLTALDFHVLLVLTEGDLYGYAIKKAVEGQSGGALSPEVGTLYRVVARLLADGLVSERDGPEEEGSHRGRPRRYYGITAKGREMARAEAARLDAVVELARGRDLLPDPHAT